LFEAAWNGGLRFACKQCSGCCSGSPGLVRLGAKDVADLIEGLDMDMDSFTAAYCRVVDSSSGPCLCLVEKSDFGCIFLESDGCSVYAFRPLQCRTYPFWEEILETEETWAQEALYCPGIGSGEMRKPEEIADCIHAQRAALPLRPGTAGLDEGKL